MFDDIPVETAGVYIDNSTISGNVANLGGGGIYNLGFINNFLSNIVAGNIDTNEYSLAAPDLFSVKYSVRPINAGADDEYLGMPLAGSSVEGFNLIGNCGYPIVGSPHASYMVLVTQTTT